MICFSEAGLALAVAVIQEIEGLMGSPVEGLVQVGRHFQTNEVDAAFVSNSVPLPGSIPIPKYNKIKIRFEEKIDPNDRSLFFDFRSVKRNGYDWVEMIELDTGDSSGFICISYEESQRG